MIIKEIQSKSILSASKIYDYVINPYVGCGHACSYCYARFIKKFTGHTEPWGEFVDIRTNAAELLKREIRRKRPGRVWVSGMCDAYQPLEEEYRLTRQCLEILADYRWPFVVQTRSPLVLRDIDIFKSAYASEVGLSITTADDSIRKIFEPQAPAISERLRALKELHDAGIRTYTMIAPLLPGAEGLAELLPDKADRIIIDRMNYHYADSIYRRHGLEEQNTDNWFYATARMLANKFRESDIQCDLV